MRGIALRLWPAVLAAWATLATAAGLPWINDNYPKALAEAKQRKLPIFVEVWAPW